MGFAIAITATIPAYVAGFVALIMGMGWLASLGVVLLTGTTVALALCLFMVCREALATRQDWGFQYSMR